MDRLTQELVDFLRKTYSPEEKTKEDKNGETTIFFRKGGKSLCYIISKGGVHNVVVVIGASLNNKIHSANLSKRAKELFDKSRQYHDGRWLNFECNTRQDVEDIQTLLSIKNPLGKSRR